MSVDSQWVRVGKVPFGRGVFARQDIPAGTDLGGVKGKIIADPEYASSYCIDLGESMSLEPQAPFRYLNHCCTPNCHLQTFAVVYDDGTPAPAEVMVEALTDIPQGAELTIDYQWSASGAIKCLCGSSDCRGWVVAEEELAELLKTKPAKTTTARKAR
ncbi:MAG: SET domain-containing protein [Planctomycetota bacterium]